MYVAWGVAQSFTVGVGVYVICVPPHVAPTRRTADSRWGRVYARQPGGGGGWFPPGCLAAIFSPPTAGRYFCDKDF